MPNPKPTFDKIKISMKLEESWNNTLNNPEKVIMGLPLKTRAIMGMTEIYGYLEACQDFGILDTKTLNEFREQYKKELKKILCV